MTSVLAWVVGRGGFLGSRVEALLPREIADAARWVPGVPKFSWTEPGRLTRELEDAARAFGDETRARRSPWMVLWCAGAGGVGTSPQALRNETHGLQRLLESLSAGHAGAPSTPGLLLHCSSGGGVYGSNPDLPLTEESRCRPISDYGRNKLVQETHVLRWAEATPGVSCLIARISNLYGPGQSLARPPGLIGRLSQSLLHRRPVNIYVPLDTLRDYIHVDDAARYILRCLRRALAGDRPVALVKIIAAEQSISIAGILGIFARVTKRAPRIIAVPQATTDQQPGRLRFRSRAWTDLAPRMVDLAAGIREVYDGHFSLFQRGRLPVPPGR
ncbi:MAG: NAD-dependent epimerase/dehydratase family protein [Candidatus Rokuibacteriota bacterium]